MPESTGSGFSGIVTEGNYEVTYRDGEEVSRREIDIGGTDGSPGSGTGGGTAGDGGRGAKISAILGSCRSFLSSLQNIFHSARSRIDAGRTSGTSAMSRAAGRIKEAARRLLPQAGRAKAASPAAPAPEEAIKDPVIKSSGLNRQTITDISMGTFGGTYAVRRHHAPCTDGGGLLGSAWASGLDTRIIRGLAPDRTEDIKALREALAAMQSDKAGIEGLDSSYDEVREELEAALSEADAAIADVSAGLEELEAAQAARERGLGRNSHVLYGGADAFAGCGDGALVLMEDGFIPILFEAAGDGSYRGTGAGRLLSVRETADGYTLRDPDGSTRQFDAYGRLSGETDRNGNTVTVRRRADGNIEEIVSPAGCSILVKSDGAGHIAGMRLLQDGEETGCAVEYGYSGGLLTSVTDTDGDTSRYEYDGGGRLTAIVKGDGSAMRYAYTECADGSVRVASTTDEEGHSIAFSHDPAARRFSCSAAGADEEVTIYDAEGRITREESGGLVTGYAYDADGNVASRTVNGERTEYSHDGRGNLTRAVYADGSTEEYGYDASGQLASAKDRDGVTETFVRDGRGNLTEYHLGGILLERHSYDSRGLCTVSEILRGGRTARVEYSYDAHGRCTERRLSDPDNAEEAFTERCEYDRRGRPVKVTSPDGKETVLSYTDKTETALLPSGLERRLTYDGRKNLVLVEETDRKRGQKLTVYYEYDKSHHNTKRVYSGGGRTLLTEELAYNGRGDLVCVTTTAAGDGVRRRQLLSYDGAGRLSSVRIQKLAPGGVVEDETERKASFRYAGAGSELAVTSAEGRSTLLVADSLGRLIKQTDAPGEDFTRSLSPAGRLLAESSSHGGLYAYSYDGLGRLCGAGEEGASPATAEHNPDGSVKKTVDRLGNVTEYTYDIRGLLTKKTSPEGTSLYEYDKAGRLTGFRRGGLKIRYAYSDDGRTVTVTRGDSVSETYGTDAWGRVIKVTDGEGNSRTLSRDALGRVIDESDEYGNVTVYRHDAWGNVSETVLPDGSHEGYEYNALGLPTKKTDGEGVAWERRYDKDGLVVEEKTRGQAVKEYSYDKLGRVTEVKSGGQTEARYGHTEYGRKETLIRAGGGKHEKAYDAYGRLVSETDSHGRTRTFTYDAEGQLCEKSSFSGSVTRVTNDRAGHKLGESFPDGSANTLRFDENGHVIKEQNPRASVEYEYDAAGLLVRQKSALTGEAIEYAYDARGLCTRAKSLIHDVAYRYGRAGELLDADDRTTGIHIRLTYDKLMRETERAFEGGVRQLTAYDKAGRVVSVRTLDRNGEVKSEYLHYGDDGRILAAMDERGRVTLYGYDAQGHVSKVLYPFSTDILSKARLEYAAAGGDRNAQADGKDITIGEVIRKAFKPLSGKDCQASQKAWEESYRYDADGNRITKTTPLGTVYYKYDSENRLVSYGVTEAADAARLEYDADGNLIKESTPTKEAVYAYNAANRMAESHVTEIRGGSRQTPKDTVYSYDSFGRRILEADILNRWARHTEYRGLTMDVWKNAAVHGIKEPRGSRGIDSSGMVFEGLGDFLPAFADFSRASPFDFTHVALTLPLTAGGEVLGLLQTEHSGIGFNPFVNASHTDAERHYYGKDHLGSVRAVMNKWGSPLRTFDYDVSGQPMQDRPERFRHGFTGKEYDGWTGLYNYGFRDYAPVLGRFTTVDPIQDGHNWYAYVNSDPVNWLDPWGLEPCKQESGEDKKAAPRYQEEDDEWYFSPLPDGHHKYEDRNQTKEERVLWIESIGEFNHETEFNGGVYQVSASSKLPIAGDFSLDFISGKVGKEFSSDGMRMVLGGSVLSVSGDIGLQHYTEKRHYKITIGGSAGLTYGYEFEFKFSEGIVIDVGWLIKPRIEIKWGER